MWCVCVAGDLNILRSCLQIYNSVAEIRYTQKEKMSKKWDTKTNINLYVIKCQNNGRELDLMDTKGKSLLYKLEWVASERQIGFKGGLEKKTF